MRLIHTPIRLYINTLLRDETNQHKRKVRTKSSIAIANAKIESSISSRMERQIQSAKHADKKTIRAVSGNEEGRQVVEKVEVKTRNIETLKYVEKKLEEKGCMRMDRHPVDGKGGIHRPPPKQGHGGKYTWEGPDGVVREEEAPVAVDEKDPNYVGEEVVDRGEEEEEEEIVIGEVEAAKVAAEGVARVEVDPRLV